MEYSSIYFEKSMNGKIIDKGNINLKYDGDEIQIQGKLKNGEEEEYINEILFVPSNVNSIESQLQRDFLDNNFRDLKSQVSEKTKKTKKRKIKKRKSSSKNKKSKKR